MRARLTMVRGTRIVLLALALAGICVPSTPALAMRVMTGDEAASITVGCLKTGDYLPPSSCTSTFCCMSKDPNAKYTACTHAIAVWDCDRTKTSEDGCQDTPHSVLCCRWRGYNEWNWVWKLCQDPTQYYLSHYKAKTADWGYSSTGYDLTSPCELG